RGAVGRNRGDVCGDARGSHRSGLSRRIRQSGATSLPPLLRPPRRKDGLMALIEDYGWIGSLETAALVSGGGSSEWLCLPRFDSAAMFAALVGDAENGHWTIQPV